MNLKTKFRVVILMSSILAIIFSLLVISALFYIDNESNISSFRLKKNLKNYFYQLESIDELDYTLLSTYNNLDLIILNNDKKIIFPDKLNDDSLLFETIPSCQIIDILSGKVAPELKNQLQLGIIEIIDNNKAGLSMIFFLPKIIKKNNTRWINIPPTTIYITVVIFLIIILIAVNTLILKNIVLSLKSLNTSVKKLDEGNLDEKIIVNTSDNEIRELANTFDMLRIKLRAEMDNRNRLILAISHDLKTPITSIKGYLEAIEDGFSNNDTNKLKKYISIISSKSELLEERILDLIKFVKLETGSINLNLENVVAKDFFKKLVDFFSKDAKFFNHQFVSKIDIPDDYIINIDQNAMIRVFENLFTNSIRYSTVDCNIHLIARVDHNGILNIYFIDKGIGIEKDKLNLIFESFYRVSKDRNSAGMGLGLSVVRSILVSHNWSISVESEKGVGTTFNIKNCI